MRRMTAALIVAGLSCGPAGLAAGEEAGAKLVPPSFEVVALPDGAETVVAGTAEPGATVEILDRELTLATAIANRRGEWAVSLSVGLAPGTYRLAVRSTSADGKEVLIADRRIDLVVPEQVAAAETAARSGLPDRVVVVPGDNLWVLARRLYGSGVHYDRLYEANRDLIARPRAIFPGQALVVPAPPETAESEANPPRP